MMLKTRLLGMLLGLGLALPVRAAVFDIADGNVTALIAAMEQARANADLSNTINLGGGTYLLSAVYEFVNEGGTPYGSVGL
ncbi:MAG: hypothetical protein HC913_23310, partial [Microscillaceae bacterium]|nr:hypothetical protein [Microscillaceae bacterium]